VALLLALVTAGCGAQRIGTPAISQGMTTSATPGQGTMVDRAVPPIVLRDPPPGQLDVQFSVQVDGITPGTPVMDEIGLAFLTEGKNVQFAGSERVICDGKDLPIHGPAISGQLVRAPAAQLAGTTIACEYTAGGASARFSLLVPATPAITSPAAGAAVARGRETLVTYQADPAEGNVMGIVALAPGSAAPKTFVTINRPGPGQATLDTSGFAAVPGTLVLSLDLAPTVTTAGAAFMSLKAFGTAYIAQAVIWT
jgi:hypothetical protein